MKNVKNNELHDRRVTATDAKAAQLAAFRAVHSAVDPAREAKRAERVAIAEARDARQAERKQAKIDEKIRLEAEAVEREAALEAEANAENLARELADKNRIARVLDDEAARKAERDKRYANRKARQA
ncbi:DUF6481 family protein [Rhizobium oryziradicis]|uniref:Uncharacterized protein n=1 Tax=Rhizobium oryziradicis TaxID=1867956 RepID=A0A1Q8ZPL2_9HYPH|nr:DUF6481 family protein [Rhizobium oryziradicis]OLP43698.1 hypothetical protein BJF95_22955 [Rhizobium oryziradicis]